MPGFGWMGLGPNFLGKRATGATITTERPASGAFEDAVKYTVRENLGGCVLQHQSLSGGR